MIFMISDPISDMGLNTRKRLYRIPVKYTDDKGKLTGEKGELEIGEAFYQQLKFLCKGQEPTYITMKKSDTCEKNLPVQSSTSATNNPFSKHMETGKFLKIMPVSDKKTDYWVYRCSNLRPGTGV